MTAVLLDTHAWAWSLYAADRLSSGAKTAIEAADTVLISPISLFEIGQKVRLGKWPEMAAHAEGLVDLIAEQGAAIADFGASICLSAGLMDWEHRDPFDRMLAATSMQHRVPIVSADIVFDGVVQRIW